MSIIMYLLYAAIVVFVVMLILDYLKQKKIKPQSDKLVRDEYTHVENDIAPKVLGAGGGFSVFLIDTPVNKQISVINAVRFATGLSLRDAKILMESAPVLIKEDIKLEEAKRIKNMLEEAGAEVEIREINEVNND